VKALLGNLGGHQCEVAFISWIVEEFLVEEMQKKDVSGVIKAMVDEPLVRKAAEVTAFTTELEKAFDYVWKTYTMPIVYLRKYDSKNPITCPHCHKPNFTLIRSDLRKVKIRCAHCGKIFDFTP